jgi:hypothetical protein
VRITHEEMRNIHKILMQNLDVTRRHTKPWGVRFTFFIYSALGKGMVSEILAISNAIFFLKWGKVFLKYCRVV